ncbi:hypothetical protein MBLNU459_g5999t2 [Dothideomycetes sp. NU459]
MLDTTIIVLKFIRAVLGYQATASPKNILVIGASFAGCEAARSLANSLPTGYRVVLIEKSSHFQFTWVFPRFSVVPGHEHKAFIPYDNLLTGAPTGSWDLIHDTVTSIRETTVLLESGLSLDYEYLIIATGSKAEAPSRLNATEKSDGIRILQSLQDKIADASNLVVVGGGAAGVELACDVKSVYPEKDVTLVHSRAHLLHSFGPKLHTAALAALERLAVQVVLNDRVEVETKTGVVFKSGKEILCDLLVRCTGQKAASDVVAELSPDSISPTGAHIRVKDTLQIADERFGHIYVAGDVACLDGPRNGRSASVQGALASKNILRAIRGKDLVSYQPHHLLEGGIELTLGLERNVLYISDGSRDTIIHTASKEVALKSASAWKRMGAKPFEDASSQDREAKMT